MAFLQILLLYVVPLWACQFMPGKNYICKQCGGGLNCNFIGDGVCTAGPDEVPNCSLDAPATRWECCTDCVVSGNTCRYQVPAAPSTSAPCFHKDTIITYAGKQHTFEEIRTHPECSIPHVVLAHGVIVTAKCRKDEKILRLTDGHLIYNQRGLQAAGDLKPDKDIVYADLAETIKCQVMSVEKETHQHDYFGLNCLTSQVLASGLKSSTFEKVHAVPAFWMQVMGRILGIKRASQLGDYIAELVQKMNLV